MDTPSILLVRSGRPPWRDSVRGDIIRALRSKPQSIPMILTPAGLLPFDLEDWAPLCHIQASLSTWNQMELPSDDDVLRIGLTGLSVDVLNVMESSSDEDDGAIRSWIEHSQISAKCSVLLGMDRNLAWEWLEGMTVQRSSTGRIKNVFDSDGNHVLSPRLNDGALSLTTPGAIALHSLDAGLPEVVSIDDAVPYLRAGRNVIHGFISKAEDTVRPGIPALIVDTSGNLVAHGIPTSTAEEMNRFRKGIAVRVRGGVANEDEL